MRKLLPVTCLAVPWELYFYTSSYSSGWGIKLSLLYANFDSQYGTLFVNVIRQLSMLSYGGFLPSLRTGAWFLASMLCIILVFYELSRDQLEFRIRTGTTGVMLIVCAVLTLVSSLAVWNSSFMTVPIAPAFFGLAGYFLLSAERSSSEGPAQAENDQSPAE
ncbi:hypothetical protein [Methanolobus chelungpuianus]|uniref:Uncharacterized protein n=1 Tax=Methanolobus chelungpuianus TaxID=502115 RepID=A0AAE3H7G3_9EURY|nr:hypothetical protein [Methanolobus chelungpuianus]MCQ6961650.1 hypothetical protein [Methanolobus chelungpuianus]